MSITEFSELDTDEWKMLRAMCPDCAVMRRRVHLLSTSYPLTLRQMFIKPNPEGFFASFLNRSSLLVLPSVAARDIASAVAVRASSEGALVGEALQRCQEGQRAYDVLNESRNVCQQKAARERRRLHWSRSSACSRNLQLCEKTVFGPCHNLLTRTEKPCLLILLRSHELCCNPVSLN